MLPLICFFFHLKVRWVRVIQFFLLVPLFLPLVCCWPTYPTLRPHRTAKQIVRPKGDKNILGRSRNFSIFIWVLNTQRFDIFVPKIGECGG